MDVILDQANKLLVDEHATADDLHKMLREVSAISEAINGEPLPKPGNAMSLDEQDKLEKDREHAIGTRRVVTNISSALQHKLSVARKTEAVANADKERQTLESAVKAAEKAAQKAVEARQAAFAELQAMEKSKQVAKGHPTVGANAEQVQRLFTLGAIPKDINRAMARNRYEAGK